MIDVTMRNENRGGMWTQRFHSLGNALLVRLDMRAKNSRHEADTGEIRIDQQCAAVGFELVTIGAEISNPNAAPDVTRLFGIGRDEVRISLQTATDGVCHENKNEK